MLTFCLAGDVLFVGDKEHGLHGAGPQQAQLHTGRRHQGALQMLRLQGSGQTHQWKGNAVGQPELGIRRPITATQCHHLLHPPTPSAMH